MPRRHRGCSGVNSCLVLHASVIQSVACHLPKVDVAGSSPAWRSIQPGMAVDDDKWPVRRKAKPLPCQGRDNGSVTRTGRRTRFGTAESWCSAAWRARLLGMQEVSGSSPLTATILVQLSLARAPVSDAG